MTMFPLEDEAREFWQACGGRGFRRAKWPKTREAYLNARKSASKEEIFAGLKSYKLAHEHLDFQYLPHSYNWLRDMQWMDFAGIDEQKHLTPEEQERIRQDALRRAANGR